MAIHRRSSSLYHDDVNGASSLECALGTQKRVHRRTKGEEEELMAYYQNGALSLEAFNNVNQMLDFAPA